MLVCLRCPEDMDGKTVLPNLQTSIPIASNESKAPKLPADHVPD